MNSFLNNPLLSWFLLPLSIIIVGTRVGAHLNSFGFYPFLLLYVFLLLLHLIENLWLKKTENILPIFLPLQKILVILLAVVLFLFSTAVNLPATFLLLLLLLFTFVVAKQSLGFEQTFFYFILQLFFQGFILNAIAFYVQTGYLAAQLLLYLLPVSLYVGMVVVFRQKNFMADDYSNSLYLRFIQNKSLHIILFLYLVATIVTVTLFQHMKTPGLNQVVFALSQLVLLLPIASKNFRMTVRSDRYLIFLVSLTIIFYIFTLI